jgi:hypothetical protein
MSTIPYRQIVGSLQHLATHSRPDIAHETATLSRFLHNPGKAHWNALKQLLRFLKYTSTYSITLGNSTESMKLSGYVDATYNKCPETGRSTFGFLFLLGTSLISWKSGWFPKSKPSSTESECAALLMATTQAIWLQNLLKAIDINNLPLLLKRTISNMHTHKIQEVECDIVTPRLLLFANKSRMKPLNFNTYPLWTTTRTFSPKLYEALHSQNTHAILV